MTKDEQLVYDLISNSNGRITQLQISKSAAWVGSHEVHEAHLQVNHQQSTLRKIRQIIRDLRIKYSKPILSDLHGYWIMKNKSEAEEYIKRIERTAKAQANAWFTTFQTMRNNFGVKSTYFEAQQKLFNDD